MPDRGSNPDQIVTSPGRTLFQVDCLTCGWYSEGDDSEQERRRARGHAGKQHHRVVLTRFTERFFDGTPATVAAYERSKAAR